MSVQFQEKSYLGQKNILATPDGYICVEVELEQNSELAVEVGGRKIVKAGTIYPANDATAKGVIFNDYDVTDGDRVGALLIAGNVLVDALPEEPEQAAVNVLPRISFIQKEGTVLGSDIEERVAALEDAENSGSGSGSGEGSGSGAGQGAGGNESAGEGAGQ